MFDFHDVVVTANIVWCIASLIVKQHDGIFPNLKFGEGEILIHEKI